MKTDRDARAREGGGAAMDLVKSKSRTGSEEGRGKRTADGEQFGTGRELYLCNRPLASAQVSSPEFTLNMVKVGSNMYVYLCLWHAFALIILKVLQNGVS